jgi:integrase
MWGRTYGACWEENRSAARRQVRELMGHATVRITERHA